MLLCHLHNTHHQVLPLHLTCHTYWILSLNTRASSGTVGFSLTVCSSISDSLIILAVLVDPFELVCRREVIFFCSCADTCSERFSCVSACLHRHKAHGLWHVLHRAALALLAPPSWGCVCEWRTADIHRSPGLIVDQEQSPKSYYGP